MKLIAKKKKPYAFLGIGLVGLIIELLFCITENANAILNIFLLIMIIVFGILFIFQMAIPKEIISLDEYNESIYLHPDDVWIKASSLKSVTFKNAFSKYGKSKHGRIIIKTQYEEYYYNHVENVEKAAQELKRLIILEEAKSEEKKAPLYKGSWQRS